MALGGLIPLAALIDFQTPLFLVWWLMGLRGSPFFFFFFLVVCGSESLQLGLANVYSSSHGGKREPMEVDLRHEEDQKLMNQGQQ